MRLVIRAEIIPDKPMVAAAPLPSRRSSRAVIVGAIAVLALICAGVVIFRTGGNRVEPALPAVQQSGPAVSDSPAPTDQSQPPPTAASTVPDEPDALPAPVNEVLPHPSPGALQTIRGTVRVLVRVTIDARGAVIAAESADPGPSRYFERLSLDSAMQWTFVPSEGDGQRTALLRFHFTRDGVTARADPTG